MGDFLYLLFVTLVFRTHIAESWSSRSSRWKPEVEKQIVLFHRYAIDRCGGRKKRFEKVAGLQFLEPELLDLNE